jgi:predicted hydrolase (HD superfamily)
MLPHMENSDDQYGELEQTLDRTLQAIDVGTGLILAEVRAGPFEDRSEVRFGSNRKDNPRADI